MKKTYLISFLALTVLFLFSSCPYSPFSKKKYEQGEFPPVATNFSDVNSPFDDYNSALPEIHVGHNLIFSSYRNTKGGTYDIIDENMHIAWDMETGKLNIDNSHIYVYNDFVKPLVNLINTDANEFGPFVLGYEAHSEPEVYKRVTFLTYSTDEGSENFRSRMVYYESNYSGDSASSFGPFDLNIVNKSNSNPQYISFFGENIKSINVWDFDPSEIKQMYFQADGDGKTDIFKIEVPDNDDFISFLTSDTTYPAQKVSPLSTPSEDKCPFINGKVMVFASDRPGGYGDYDLYYSFYENGEWTKPVNFGDKINSAYDEFRPVTLFADGFKTDLLIFSSNRPGGLGGFDLYYAALPFKIFDWGWIVE